MVTARLKAWSDNNGGRLPDNIIYYRDGVSEGQYSKIKTIELPGIRAAFDALDSTSAVRKKVKITAIVGVKRHHTRFFPMIAADKQGEHGNCMPGTLVQDMVTSPYFADFYLQSHSGLQGTARPTHYFLLEDEINMGLANLQKFVCRPFSHALSVN
jgi:eukaryotic translation initiation factor 2C